MIALPSHTKIWIAAGVTDLRRGFSGLSALVQTKLEQNRSRVKSSSFAGAAVILVETAGITQALPEGLHGHQGDDFQ